MEPVSDSELGRWFKMYASIIDHPVFSDAQAYRAFGWCMRRACWRATYSHGKQIPRGSFWTTNRDGAVECHSSIETWRKAMAKLVELEMITIESTSTHTFVTIINYDKYQGDEPMDGVLKNSTPSRTRTSTPSSTPTGTPTSTRSRSTRTGSNEDTPAAAPPGGSSDRPARPKTKPPAFDPLAIAIPASLDTPLFRGAWAAWAAHRVEIKARLTEQSTRQQIRLLVELGHDKAVETIRTSIRQSWRGLFPEQAKTSAYDRPAAPPSVIPGMERHMPVNQRRLIGE